MPRSNPGARFPQAVELTGELIRRRSITPDDAGCRDLLAERLLPYGFTCECFDRNGVSNTWFRHGNAEPLLLFAGHTDVVPPGPEEAWDTPPFEPTTREGVLYGRGAADMKSGVAAMVTACMQFVAEQPKHAGSCAILLTSDEEGEAVDGTRHAVEQLRARKDIPQWCVVGEPSADRQVGDKLRVGRRGSLSARLVVRGVQGHVAYPDKARNPIHALAPALQALCGPAWKNAPEKPFPPTGLQVTDIHAGVGAPNVTPGELELFFNIRYSPPDTAEELQARIVRILDDAELDYTVEWTQNAEPFLSPGTRLVEVARMAVGEIVGCETRLSAGGGTSDGRFIAPLGCELIELGVPNESIHKVNERVCAEDIERLTGVYLGILNRLLV